MKVVIAGGGSVGRFTAEQLVEAGHEVTIIENDRAVVREYADDETTGVKWHQGDACDVSVLAAAGVTMADVVASVTGDDEDNIIIGQLSRDHFGVANVVARVNDPRNQEHFDLLGIAPTVCATESILALIEHEVPQHSLVHLFSLRRENLDILEIGVVEGSRADGATVGELSIPDGSLVISVLRNRVGRVAHPDTLLAAGDQVVAIAEPGRESDLMEIFAGD